LSRARAFNVVTLPSGERFTRDFFVDKVMGSFARMRMKKMPRVETRGTLLYLDNAHPHLTPETFEYHDITKLSHPRYHSDLSQRDCWPFGYIKATLDEFFFQDINEARDRMMEILRAIAPGTFI
jgi:hypothetical protein